MGTSSIEDGVNPRIERFFQFVIRWPKAVILLGLILMFAVGSFIPSLQKDTRSDAFMPPDHPALIYRDQVKEIFGLKDPMVIAIVNEKADGVFNPETLKLVKWLTDEVAKVTNIDPERVTSLATENDIIGTHDGMVVTPFLDPVPITQADANKVRTAVMDFPLYLGSLVSRDGNATLIVAELIDQSKAQAVYQTLLNLTDSAPVNNGESIHIAGEGAVSGYMGAYIDADAQRLNPIAGLIITFVLFIAFRTLRGTLIPNLVVMATVASALGMMAFFNISFFVITNALPVVLIGIAVADSIHIFSQYYEEIARAPKDSAQQIVVRMMLHMWRPITLTTLTTMAGFLGLSLASVMPPMTYFGLFAMLGVAVAGIYSLTVVPAFLSLLRLKPSKAYSSSTVAVEQNDFFGGLMLAVGRVVIKAAGTILILSLAVAGAGLFAASKLELNESRITIFQKDEPIVKADSVINETFDGAHYVDIVIDTPNNEDLFEPENLQRIEALQKFVTTLDHVNGSTSIVDYLKQMNRALNEDNIQEYRLPEDADLIAQYFLLYSASGDPTDFDEVVDYDYRLANVRVRMDSSLYTNEKVVIEAIQPYLDKNFNTSDISANISGRVNIDYHWIERLGESHFGSVAVSLLLVWLMASLSFRSVIAGLFTVIPVALSILLIYAAMGVSGIWLAVGTSMFAAIAIGLGVDFAVHTLERLVALVRKQKLSIDEAILRLYPSTGRALLFNFIALAFGFGVLATSEVVPLIRFGVLVSVAVTVSFITSMTVLPALVKVFEPKFVGLPESQLENINETGFQIIGEREPEVAVSTERS